MEKNRFEKVKEHWESQKTVSLRDTYLKKIEINKVKDLIQKSSEKPELALEIGCGDGEGTREYAESIENAVALDYSLTMLEKAKENCKDKKNVFFVRADVRNLPFKNAEIFDLIISERCLINLPDNESQKEAVNNLNGLLKPESNFIFVEGTKQGLDNLNSIRGKLDLTPIPMPWHNLFFDEDKLEEVLNPLFEINDKGSFWFYYIGSRALNPAYVYPDNPSYESRINELSSRIHSHLDKTFTEDMKFPYSIGQIFYLLLKKKASPE